MCAAQAHSVRTRNRTEGLGEDGLANRLEQRDGIPSSIRGFATVDAVNLKMTCSTKPSTVAISVASRVCCVRRRLHRLAGSLQFLSLCDFLAIPCRRELASVEEEFFDAGEGILVDCPLENH